MSVSKNNSPCRPRVCLIGEYEHPDFGEAVALFRSDAVVIPDNDMHVGPDLIVVASSRPGVIGRHRIDQLRRAAPLAGVVALLGSWCEGHGRTGPSIHDALQLYWHQFAPWWRRQLQLRAAGRCADWSRPDGRCPALSTEYSILRRSRDVANGAILLSTPRWATADAISETLRSAGYATVWQPPGRPAPLVRGVAAGIWDGGQLNKAEATDLAAFCRHLDRESVPVVALMDYPRRDLCELAHHLGAAAELGKPWINADLLQTLHEAVYERNSSAA